jgi:neopullulanase
LIGKAHAKGMRVLVDLVGNHVHTDSPLWTLHKHDGWFNTPDNPYVCGWDRPITCWFTPYLADLDYTNADALQTVMDHAVWLVQTFDIDGFRLDAVKHMVMDFTTALRKRMKNEITTTGIPFYMVGETFDGDKNLIASYVGPDKLDGQFDFPLYFQVRDVLLSQSAGLDQLKGFVESNDGYYQGRWSGSLMSNFMGNHDVERALSYAGGDFARVRMTQTFLFTSPAIPLIFQGDDIGMEGGGDPFNRKMMVFTGLSSGQQETLNHLKKLGKFRLAHRAARYGVRTTLESNGTFWAYKLKDGADEVIVVLNRGGQATKTYATSLSGTVKDVVSGTTLTVSGGQVTVTVPAMGTAVISTP